MTNTLKKCQLKFVNNINNIFYLDEKSTLSGTTMYMYKEFEILTFHESGISLEKKKNIRKTKKSSDALLLQKFS